MKTPLRIAGHAPARRILALVACAPLVALAANDVLLLHGHVYTGNPRLPWAEALAVRDGRIEAVGSDRAIGQLRADHRQVIDLHGRTVIPGIVDSHVHMLFGAYALHGLNLTTPQGSITAANPDQVVARLKSYAAEHPQDPVILGRADFSATPPSTPTKELLDRAVPDRPVVIHNSSEHSLWVNSAALRLAGITDYPVAEAQEERGIIRDASGHPRGVLIEAGMEVMERAVAAQLPEESKLAMLEQASRYLNSYGITSIVNATGSAEELRLYAMLRDRGRLSVRTRTAFGAVAVAHRLTPEFLAELEAARGAYHDEWVSANLVKFFADGFSGLIPPLVYEPHAYDALVTELDRRGFQLMTHAARDDSVHMILDAYQRAIERNGPRDRRLRLEHADVTDEADLARFAPLAVTVVMEPSFCCAATGLNYDLEHLLPTDRWRSFLDKGTTLAFASDWPCTQPPDPFLGIEQAVTRAEWRSADTESIVGNPFDGAGQGGAKRTGMAYVPGERITVEEAVRAYTAGSAYAAFMDDRVGTLEAGKAADLVVLSQDLFSVPHEAIGATRAVITMVGGRVVYRGDDAASPSPPRP
jgi:predicted amidohydrolase YtcJ